MKQVANVQLMQKMNREKVLTYIRNHPDAVRPQIAAETGLSLASITNITAFLLSKGLLKESGIEQVGRVGRKSILLSFNPDAWGLVCVVILPDSVQVSYTDLSGRVLSEQQKALKNMTAQDLIDWLSREIQVIKERASLPVLGVGIAVSGLVLDSRTVLSSSLGWRSVDLKSSLETRLSLPVFVENITMARAVWELNQEGRTDGKNRLFLDISNGIGSAQFYGGKVRDGMIGEIGHTTVEKDGAPCFCGNRGCLEVMCSKEKILREFKKKTGKTVSGAELQKLADEKNPIAEALIRKSGEYLGIGMANLVNLLNPDTIYINNSDFSDLPGVLAEGEAVMRKRAYPMISDKLEILVGKTPAEGVIGGIAIHLCDLIFSADFPGSILE